MTCLHHVEKIKLVDALYCSRCKFWLINHQCLIKRPCHAQKMRLCRTNKQTDFPGAISLLAVGLLPQPLVEFKMTHCVDIWCTDRNPSQLLPPNPLIFQQIHKVLRLLPLRELIHLISVAFVRHPLHQQGEASVSLNLSNLVKQLHCVSVVSHLQPWGHLLLCVVSRLLHTVWAPHLS